MHPYAYELPAERIAQRPVHPYDAAKMLVADRAKGEISSRCFRDIVEYLKSGDLLIFNDTRVIPARFLGSFEDNGGEAEILLVRRTEADRWRCIGRPLRRFRKGRTIVFPNGLSASVGERAGEREVEISFRAAAGADLHRVMDETGQMPIPPYIRNGRSDGQDRVDYQTIFARTDGSIAAPTASLHFTPTLMELIRASGCGVDFLTLHVGTASFLPLDYDEASGFLPPGEEQFSVSSHLRDRMNETRASGGRVIGVGTTVVRALETAVRRKEQGCSQAASTSLFITPGFQFMAVDSVVTNFHQPGTTHLLLVEALMGRELLDAAYQFALGNEYRFLSYGDGMMII